MKLTLEDFKLCFSIIGLVNEKDYALTGDGQGGRPRLFFGSTIDFLNYPDVGKEAGFCDIAYINEVLETAIEKMLMTTLKALFNASYL